MTVTLSRRDDGALVLEIGDAKGTTRIEVAMTRNEVARLMLQASEVLYVQPKDEAEREYEYFAHRNQT